MERFKITTTDKEIGHIYQTYDYKKFKIDQLNRPVNRQHADNLYKKLIKNPDFILEPIIVDLHFNIIDGQHRYTALRKAKLPINYIVDTKIHIGDAKTLNSNARNWQPEEYLIVLANAGNPNYQHLRQMYQQYKDNFALSTLIAAFNKSSAALSHGPTRAFKKGNYIFNSAQRLEIGQYLDWLISLQRQLGINNKVPRYVLASIKPWYFNQKVSRQRLKKCLTRQIITNFTSNVNHNQMQIGQAYNKYLTANRINYAVDANGKFMFL